MEHLTQEKGPAAEFESRVLQESEKETYREEVLGLLKEYPDQFFPELFEESAVADFEKNQVVLAFRGGKAVGCLFFNPETHECDWLAITKDFEGSKSPLARKLFETAFALVPKGTRVFWYVNTEDAVFEGKPVGRSFEPARRLYRSLGGTFTRVENKFGQGNHAYLVEVVT